MHLLLVDPSCVALLLLRMPSKDSCKRPFQKESNYQHIQDSTCDDASRQNLLHNKSLMTYEEELAEKSC